MLVLRDNFFRFRFCPRCLFIVTEKICASCNERTNIAIKSFLYYKNSSSLSSFFNSLGRKVDRLQSL